MTFKFKEGTIVRHKISKRKYVVVFNYTKGYFGRKRNKCELSDDTFSDEEELDGDRYVFECELEEVKK